MSACRFVAQTATFCVVSATCRRHVSVMSATRLDVVSAGCPKRHDIWRHVRGSVISWLLFELKHKNSMIAKLPVCLGWFVLVGNNWYKLGMSGPLLCRNDTQCRPRFINWLIVDSVTMSNSNTMTLVTGHRSWCSTWLHFKTSNHHVSLYLQLQG